MFLNNFFNKHMKIVIRKSKIIDFAIEAISGVDNKLDQIVILPFLDNANAKLTGGDQDVVLSMADVPGFSIKVFANSTFVRDPVTGALVQQPVTLSSSQVKFDKVPMVPPLGSAPLVVGTLQPAGIIFNPPAAVCYPNTTGLSPGDVADIFAFHHDIGSFVSIGPGTVSEDGSVVCSDSGFGIVKSGWHCTMRNPAPTSRCANDCRFDIKWSITKNGMMSKESVPVIMCMVSGESNLEDPPPEQQEALITVSFSPPDGSNDAVPVWKVEDPSVVEIIDLPSNEDSVHIRAKSKGTTRLFSPVYRIRMPDDPSGDKTCQAVIDVKVVKVEFDKSKVKIQNLNLVPGEDKAKYGVHIYFDRGPSKQFALLDPFLTNDSDNKDDIIWRIDNSPHEVGVLSFTSDDILLNCTFYPFSPVVDSFKIEAVHREFVDADLVDGKRQCSDSMILVLVPKSTENDFNAWYETEKKPENMEWINSLPSVYRRLGVGRTDPEPLPGDCNVDLWGSLTKRDPLKDFIHPGAVYDYRSHFAGDGHGNQATYDEGGIIIPSGLGAGSADKVNPDCSLTGHFLADFLPYVWAAQLDGNPIKITTIPDNLNKPLMHDGDNLKKYLFVRPNPGGVMLEPGDCGTGIPGNCSK